MRILAMACCLVVSCAAQPVEDAGLDGGGSVDSGMDAGRNDLDGGADAGMLDAGMLDAGPSLEALRLIAVEGTLMSAVDTSAASIDAGTLRVLSVAAATSDYPNYTRYLEGAGLQLVGPGGVAVTDVTVDCALDGVAVACGEPLIRAKAPDFALHDFSLVVHGAAGAARRWELKVADVPAYVTASTPQVSASGGVLSLGDDAQGTGRLGVTTTLGARSTLYVQGGSGAQAITLGPDATLFANTALTGSSTQRVTLRMRSTSRAYVFGALTSFDFQVEPGAVLLFDSFFDDNTLAPW